MTEQTRSESVPPQIAGVLETVLYFTDQDRTERFYRDVLGMRLLDKEPGRSLFFRVGSSVILLFNPERTLDPGKLPPHGATGPIHTCFRVPAEDYSRWKTHLIDSGVQILKETEWERGLSFYFLDPDGNLLELADADIWPR